MSQQYADNLAREAARLSVMVRDDDPQVVGKYLAGLPRDHLEHLTIALAAMVPDDQSVGQLLRWCDPDIERREANVVKAKLAREGSVVRVLAPHGTHAAFNRHKSNGQEPCDDCSLGERIYQRERARRRRAKDIA